MKKVTCLLVLGLVLFMSLTSAISLEMGASYNAKETVSARIIGNILEPISTSQVILKKGHVETAVEFDVKKLGSDYYIWLITPAGAGEYTLWIKDMYATVSGEPKRFDFAQNFTVTNGTSGYYAKPGFIYSSADFSMTAVLNEDASKEIIADYPSRTITLEPGENKIEFLIKNFEYRGLYYINVGRYKIPAYVITGKEAPVGINLTENESEKNNETINITEEGGRNYSLEFYPARIKRSVYKEDEAIYSINVKNDGKEDITDLSAEYDRMIFTLSPRVPSSLGTGEEFEFNLSVINTNDYVNEKITFSIDDREFYLPIEINFTSNKTEAKYVPFEAGKPSFWCEELLGKICKTGESCSGESIASKNGNCCIGDCTAAEEETGSSWIGWVIALIVLAGIGFLFYKYKSVHKEENPLAKKVHEAEEKLSP